MRGVMCESFFTMQRVRVYQRHVQRQRLRSESASHGEARRVTAARDLRASADVNQGQRAENWVVHWVVRHMHDGHGGVVERVAPSREALVGVGVEVVPVINHG
jgi:hypothetical protein